MMFKSLGEIKNIVTPIYLSVVCITYLHNSFYIGILKQRKGYRLGNNRDLYSNPNSAT